MASANGMIKASGTQGTSEQQFALVIGTTTNTTRRGDEPEKRSGARCRPDLAPYTRTSARRPTRLPRPVYVRPNEPVPPQPEHQADDHCGVRVSSRCGELRLERESSDVYQRD